MKGFGFAKAVAKKAAEDRITYDAAALTYYALLALVPAMIIAVALLAITSQEGTVDEITSYLSDKGVSGPVTQTIDSALSMAVQRQGTAIGALILSVVVSLYSASRLMLGARTALNRFEGHTTQINFFRSALLEIVSTLILIILIVIAYSFVLIGDDLARDIFRAIGVEDDLVTVWSIVRWLAALLIAGLAICAIYVFAPRESFSEIRRIRVHIRRVFPGACAALVVWILASAGFNFYVQYFADYDQTYGFMAGTVLLLIWLWLSSLALLLGAEVNVVRAQRKGEQLAD